MRNKQVDDFVNLVHDIVTELTFSPNEWADLGLYYSEFHKKRPVKFLSKPLLTACDECDEILSAYLNKADYHSLRDISGHQKTLNHFKELESTLNTFTKKDNAA